MIGKSTTPKRPCPHCANSIGEDAASCPFCKADLLSPPAPPWLNRDEPSSEPRVGSKSIKTPFPAKFIWPAAMLVVASIAFFAGGYRQRSEQLLLSQADSKQLQAKEQMLQSQEAQLAQARQQLTDNSNQLAEMKTKFEESQKELSATKQRLGAATREAARVNANRSTAPMRTASRAPDAAMSLPGSAARRTSDTGVYETTRDTTVYENPSPAARVITQIGKGTRINVVSATGDWLEVRSKHGNPPGYVRSDEARPIARAN